MGNATAIKKIAERDFYVYKIGRVPWNSIFVSHFKNFDYIPKVRNRKIPLIVQCPCRDTYIMKEIQIQEMRQDLIGIEFITLL